MYNYGIKRKLRKKSDDETMVDFNNKDLNDWMINTNIRVVEMTAGGCG